MRLFIIVCTVSLSLAVSLAVMAGNRGKGEKCVMDTECAFDLICASGVCVKKKEFDFGSSGKSGKPCNIDADCINSGACVEGLHGKKVCSGN